MNHTKSLKDQCFPKITATENLVEIVPELERVLSLVKTARTIEHIGIADKTLENFINKWKLEQKENANALVHGMRALLSQKKKEVSMFMNPDDVSN